MYSVFNLILVVTSYTDCNDTQYRDKIRNGSGIRLDVLYTIKAYNHLPINIKELSYDVKRFKLALKTFFQTNSFYSLEEYFNFNPQL
jgi:hypothetical protein